MRWIYLSPHLDDAALCAGGLIYEQTRAGEIVEIWTAMAGFPATEELSDFAREMHKRWSTTGARQTVEARRQEDQRAAVMMEALPIHLRFPDAIYRRGPDGSALYGDPVGAQVSPFDAELPAQIRDDVGRRLRFDDRVVCPLGVGDHVDHVLVRQAAEMLDRPLLFIADFPYALRHPEAIEGKVSGLTASVEAISESGVIGWLRSVEIYRSQQGSVFEELDPETAIRDYWAIDQGIKLWTS